MPKHILTILDIPHLQAHEIIARAIWMKMQKYSGDILKNKTILLIFEKASTRTRISFEVAVGQLGGQSIFMTTTESQIGRAEPIKDTSRVLSRYADALVVRTFAQSSLEEMAEFSSIPVINALTDDFHPCQVLSDIMTIMEREEDLSKVRVAWIGDGNNVAHSWINAAIYFPFELFMTFPEGYTPKKEFVARALQAGAKIFMTHDPEMGLAKANYVYTDVWASMGQEEEEEQRKKIFEPYQVNEKILARVAPESFFMHCLPAHRGEEVTEEVLEGPRSIIWEQAENRLHTQKAILEWIFT